MTEQTTKKEIAKYQKEIEKIKGQVEEAEKYWRENYDNYHKFRQFIFNTTLTESEKQKLNDLKIPALEFNITEAYVSRLLGEWSKQTPSFSVHSEASTQPNPQMVVFAQGHLRYVLAKANSNSFSDEVYKEALSGGFSVMKVITEYKDNKSYDQIIKLTKPYDPTLCGFDPLARESHKGDGRFCYEKFPMTKEEFKDKYPDVDLNTISFSKAETGFSWAYSKNKTDVMMVIDFYKKEITYETLCLLDNDQVMLNKDYLKLKDELANDPLNILPIPTIKRKRDIKNIEIVRIRCIKDEVLEVDKTNYDELPLIFVDGNSAYLNRPSGDTYGIEGQHQKTRSYFYNIQSTQQLKNYAGQKLAAEIENTMMSKIMAAEEAIPDQEEYKLGWSNPQIPANFIYKARDKENQPNPPPTAVPRTPIPPEIAQTFTGMDQLSQTILGSYDASLGIQEKQLSGIAIVEGATQSNNAAMPYVISYLQALGRVARIILNLIPKYYVTPRTVPIIDIKGERQYMQINQPQQPGQPGQPPPQQQSLNLRDIKDPFEVEVKAGTNFEVQQNRSLQFVSQLAQQFDSVKALINTEGLPWLISNLNIRGSEELKQMATQFQQRMKQQQQQGQKPDPNQELVKVENKKADATIQKNNADASFKHAQLKLAQDKEAHEQLKTRLKAQMEQQTHLLNLAKVEIGRDEKAAEVNFKMLQQNQEDIRDLLTS